MANQGDPSRQTSKQSQDDTSGNLGGPPTSKIPRTPDAEGDDKDSQHDTPRGKDYGTNDKTPQQGGM